MAVETSFKDILKNASTFRPSSDACFCRAELNSEIKHGKSTAGSAVLQDSGTVAIQTSCFCRAKLNSLITLTYFDGTLFSRKGSRRFVTVNPAHPDLVRL